MAPNATPIPSPTVGVIVPCFNQGSYAAQAIGSIAQQTWPAVQTLLVDDASTDGKSREQCLRLREDHVRILCESRNRGRSTVRQYALKMLGPVDYVLMMDCDDYLSPDYIKQLITALSAQPECGFAYGTLQFVSESGVKMPATWPKREWSGDSAYTENVIPGPGVLFRHSALCAVEGWRPDFNECSAEDMDIALQLIDAGWKPLWVPSAHYYYRQHPSSFLATADRHKQALADLAILRYHRHGITATIGVRKFLNRNVIPVLAESIRRFRTDRVLRMTYRGLRAGPTAVFSGLFAFYFQQFARLVRIRR